MARQLTSPFTGTVDGFSFYYDRLHGYLVRRTGGVSSKDYHRDARYAAARDASSEFSAVSRAGKLIREAFGEFAAQVKDTSIVNRLNRQLVALKQQDNLHVRGERRAATMMTDGTANRYFRIFQFNEAAPVYSMTTAFPVVKRNRHGLTAEGIRLRESAFPDSATHAGLTLVRAVIDFETGTFERSASRMAVVSRDVPAIQSPVIGERASQAGIEIVCLQVVFFREQNGDLVQLEGKVHGMGICCIKNTLYCPKRSVSRSAITSRLRREARGQRPKSGNIRPLFHSGQGQLADPALFRPGAGWKCQRLQAGKKWCASP